MEEVIEIEYLNYPHYRWMKYGGKWVKPDLKTTTAKIEKR